jgi:hypothetical protein
MARGAELQQSQIIINTNIYLSVSHQLPILTINKLLSTAILKPTTQLLILIGGILCAFTMASIFQRLTRPFTSSTLRFTPDQAAQSMTVPEGAQKATLAAGCFWGIEHMYRKDFGGKGLLDARVGYIGGNTKNPSYRAVCSGGTGRE